MRFPVCHVPYRLNSLVSVCYHSLRRYGLKTRSYYEVLGVGANATRKEIKAAFIEKSKKLHPDRNMNDPKTHDKFVKLNEAYTTLSDPGLKSLYDGRKGFMGYRQTAYSNNNRSPHYHNRSDYSAQDYYYSYDQNDRKENYQKPQTQKDKIRETAVGLFFFMIAVYGLFYIFERVFKKANTIDVDFTNWIRNHHEAKAFRDKMYVQRILTDYYDTLDPRSQQTLRTFPRTTRYQILLEMYEEKMNKEAAEKAAKKAKVQAEKKEAAEKSEKDLSSDEKDYNTTVTLNLVDLSNSSNHEPTVKTS